jgi:hypothetical protein
MSEQDEQVGYVQEVEHYGGGSNAGKWILLLLGVVYVAASIYLLFDLRGRVDKLGQEQVASHAQIAELTKRMLSTEAEAETLAAQIGMTKKELATRAQQLQQSQREAEARLSKAQQEQISAVSGEVAGVKSDVGGVKTDVASTRSDLEATKAKLESTIGDLGLQSGLVAKTREDLEVLKHKGDRNYYEFTLLRGAKPQAVSTVTLQLKKLDEKRGKYTLNVTSDDKTIEKKDRNVNEPIQFYSGRDHLLYELVVWTIDKNKATGYVSTPKNAPVPVTASPTAANQ